jgi:signal transduction histidine kinase
MKLNFSFRQEWFLFFSQAFLVLHGFVRYQEAIHWSEIVFLFLEYSFWSVLLTFLFGFFLQFRKATLFSFSIVLFNGVFGNVYDFISKGPVIFFTRFIVVVSIAVMLFILLFIFLKRTRYEFKRTTKFLNLLFFLFIGMEVFQFSLKQWQLQKNNVETRTCTTCASPDVYLIITDGYAGKKQLTEELHFNNQAFEDSLKSLGFYIADSSFSNYSSTYPSMASLLNMNYIISAEDDDVHVRMNNNAVINFFDNQGYHIINNSFFKIAGQFPKQPILYFRTGESLITRHSFVSRFRRFISNVLQRSGVESEIQEIKNLNKQWEDEERLRDRSTMQNLLAIVKGKSTKPRFVYTHFLMPHAPYLFQPNGQSINTSLSIEQQYIQYLQYSNVQLLQAVTSIINNSSSPPVILLLSDHGYRNDSSQKLSGLRFYNLSAIRLPGKNYRPYYKGISTVNQFRLLLNNSFMQQLELLPDSTVY